MREDYDSELWFEFMRKGLCGLCGNYGYINSITNSPAGEVVILQHAPCICPNGRAIRAAGQAICAALGSEVEDAT